MFHRKIQPVTFWNQSISSLEEERDSAECGRLHATEGGGGEEQVMLSQTHETQVQMKPSTPDTENKGDGLAEGRPILAQTHSFDYNGFTHLNTCLLRFFGWFLLFGINRWQCGLILLNFNVMAKMCVFQKEAASPGEKTFEMSLKPIAIIELTRSRRKRFDFGDERAAAWRDPGEVAVKGKKLIILLKDVQASLLTRWLHLLFHQPEC